MIFKINAQQNCVLLLRCQKLMCISTNQVLPTTKQIQTSGNWKCSTKNCVSFRFCIFILSCIITFHCCHEVQAVFWILPGRKCQAGHICQREQCEEILWTQLKEIHSAQLKEIRSTQLKEICLTQLTKRSEKNTSWGRTFGKTNQGSLWGKGNKRVLKEQQLKLPLIFVCGSGWKAFWNNCSQNKQKYFLSC